MSEEATDFLVDVITDRIDYARKEFELTYAELIGTLDIIKAVIIREALAEAQPEEPWK